MSGKDADTIGGYPVHHLPLADLAVGGSMTAWLASYSIPPGETFGLRDSSDAFQTVLEAGRTYVYTLTSHTQFYPGFWSQLNTSMGRIDPDDPLGLGYDRLFSGWRTTTSVNAVSFEFTPDETDAYMLAVQRGYYSGTDDVNYTIELALKPDPPPPPETGLPDLTDPAAGSLEWALYTELRTTDRKITYWFAPRGEEESRGWNADLKEAAEGAMAEWARVARLRFVEVDAKELADWVLTTSNGPPQPDALADFDMPRSARQTGRFDRTHKSLKDIDGHDNLTPGASGFETFLHEFGHGLGMAHPHEAVDDSTILPGVGGEKDRGDHQLNQSPLTVLSYAPGFEVTYAPEHIGPQVGGRAGWHAGFAATPGAIDIAVAQRLYGARNSAMRDDVYELPRNKPNGAPADGVGWRAIWDTGGDDEIRAKGDEAARIDLRPATLKAEAYGAGAPSFVNGVAGGFFIAAGVRVEKGRGGGGDDEIMGSATANRLFGQGGRDTLWGGGGKDRLKGGDDRDTLFGGPGDDTLNGQKGLDTVDYSGLGAAVTVFLGSLVAEAQGVDTLLNVERVIGSDHDDTLEGSKEADTLEGGGGKDLIKGLGGDDLLIGGGGPDEIRGGGGEDELRGGSENDTLHGDKRKDVLAGGAGDDTLYGGGGGDVADYSEAPGGVVVDLASGTASGAHGSDSLEGIERIRGSNHADTLTGDAGRNRIEGLGGDDTLMGGDDVDVLVGGQHDDVLIGGAGKDGMRGGGGADRFVWNDADESGPKGKTADLIKGFGNADRLDLSPIDAHAGGGDDAFELTGRYSGAGGELRLRYVLDSDLSILIADLDGDRRTDFAVRIIGAQVTEDHLIL